MEEQLNNNDFPFRLIPARGKESHKIPVRSEAIQEVISKRPSFLEQWALMLFLSILLLLLAGTWVINYPDTIEAKAFLTANNAPKEIVARQEGRLIRLFVKNDDFVERGQMIGWIESIANHSEVITFSQLLDSSCLLMISGQMKKAAQLFNHNYKNLGELQGAYQQFIIAWQQFSDYQVNDFYSHKKGMLLNDILTLKEMNRSFLYQKKLMQQDVRLAEESFKMNKILSEQNVISREEFRTENSKFVNKQMAIPQLNENILSNENLQRDKQKEINQLDHDIVQQRIFFLQALETIKSAVDDWQRKYLLIAPVKGKMVFITPLQENQFLVQGRLLGYINPNGTLYYAQTILPQNNFGKIDTGLDVQLRFDAYPYEEYGLIKGKLDYVSKVATDSGFLATVRFNNGLLTNQHINIQYKSGLRAKAIIITKNMRLLERIYFNIVKSTSTNR